MRRVLIVVTAAVLAMLAGSFASAEPAKAGTVSQAGEAQVRVVRASWYNHATNLCLDQDYTDNVPHSAIIVWPCNTGTNQNWFIYYNSNNSITLVNERSGQCLDQDYTDAIPHYDVIAWRCNGDSNQQWYPQFEPDGTYLLINVRSGYVLDQDFTGGVPHPRVVAVPYHDGPNQYWHKVEH